MIKVNNNDFPFEEELSISDILKAKKYMDHMIIVKVNDLFIRKEDYPTKTVKDGDDVKVIHLFGGG